MEEGPSDPPWYWKSRRPANSNGSHRPNSPGEAKAPTSEREALQSGGRCFIGGWSWRCTGHSQARGVGSAGATLIFFVTPALKEDFTYAKKFEHVVLSDGTCPPRIDNYSQFLGFPALGVGIRAQLETDLLDGDMTWGYFGGNPPVAPRQLLRERPTHTGGDIGEDAVLTRLAELAGFRCQPPHFLLGGSLECRVADSHRNEANVGASGGAVEGSPHPIG